MDGQAPLLMTSGDSDGARQGTRVVVAPLEDGDKARHPKPGDLIFYFSNVLSLFSNLPPLPQPFAGPRFGESKNNLHKKLLFAGEKKLNHQSIT